MVQRKPLFIFIILQLKLPSLELTFFAFVLLKEIIAQDIIWINSFQTERCLQKLHFLRHSSVSPRQTPIYMFKYMSFEVPCSSEILISFYICSAAALMIESAEKHFLWG